MRSGTKMSVNPMYGQSPEGGNRRGLISFSSEDTAWIWGIQHIQAACSNNSACPSKRQEVALCCPTAKDSLQLAPRQQALFLPSHRMKKRQTNKISKHKLAGIRTFLPILFQLMKIKGFYFFLKNNLSSLITSNIWKRKHVYLHTV